MTNDLSAFAARLRRFISTSALRPDAKVTSDARQFGEMAIELFALQFRHNAAYRRFCQHRGRTPETVTHWPDIPAMPTSAFKELEITCLPPGERVRVFHSSGTTAHRPSRHFHDAESLALYEASLLPWFARHLLGDPDLRLRRVRCVSLSPEPDAVPHSSLAHMFGAVRREFGTPESVFVGQLGAGGSWTLDFPAASAALRAAEATGTPVVVLGTAFSFVNLLDELTAADVSIRLSCGSRVMETGGYKGRSRSLPRTQLHALITHRLGVPPAQIIGEYGMSELSSQAYDAPAAADAVASENRGFHFPPWARVRIISPETGREVADGEAGLIRVFDLANAFSVMAVQTEDLAVRRGEEFELLGRAERAEPRGCSLVVAAT